MQIVKTTRKYLVRTFLWFAFAILMTIAVTSLTTAALVK